MPKSSRAFAALLVGLIAGLAGESLLFLERQCWAFERSQREDFRIFLFLPEEPEEGPLKVLEEKLLALPDVEGARFVTRREALTRLRREEPELVESIALVGENPLMPAFEVRLAAEAFPALSQWVLEAQRLEKWADLRYKTGQVQAVLQAQFYGHFIRLSLSAILLLLGLGALRSLWAAAKRARPWTLAGAAGLAKAPAVSAAGAAAGAIAVAGLVLPMRAHASWWDWPSGPSQLLLLVAAALAGWLLCSAGD